MKVCCARSFAEKGVRERFALSERGDRHRCETCGTIHVMENVWREVQPPSITCPRCARTSYNLKDISEGYCGACHDWTSQRPPPAEAVLAAARAAVAGAGATHDCGEWFMDGVCALCGAKER